MSPASSNLAFLSAFAARKAERQHQLKEAGNISLETKVSLRQAFLVMHAYVSLHHDLNGKPDAIRRLLNDLSLWDTESGPKEPWDGAVFPDWLSCAEFVLEGEATPRGYREADVRHVEKDAVRRIRR